MNWVIAPLKYLLDKAFDKKVPFNRVVIVLIFLAFLILASLYYFINIEEPVIIQKAEIERN